METNAFDTIVLFFSLSKIIVCRSIAGFVYGSWSRCLFYGFTGIINHRFLTNQITRTISVIL